MGLAVADVDGDGKLDIIVSDYDYNIVSVYQNTCTPGNITTNSFAPPVDFAVGCAAAGCCGAGFGWGRQTGDCWWLIW